MIEPRYLTRPEAAEFLRLTLKALDALKFSRKIPYIQEGRRIFFDRLDLIAYREALKHPAHEGLRVVLG